MELVNRPRNHAFSKFGVLVSDMFLTYVESLHCFDESTGRSTGIGTWIVELEAFEVSDLRTIAVSGGYEIIRR